jgi:hypothetical protein
MDLYGYTFLKGVEMTVNYRLESDHIVFLNDVYKLLGFKPTLAGQSVGWVYDKAKPIGDNYILFDLKHVHYKNKDGSLDPATLIGFNVQGNILGRAVEKGLITAT